MMNFLLNKAYSIMERCIRLAPLMMVLLAVSCSCARPAVKTHAAFSSAGKETTAEKYDMHQSLSVFAKQDAAWSGIRMSRTAMSGNWIRREYSQPDSAGQQHLIAEITGGWKANGNEEQRDTSRNVSELMAEAVRNDSLSSLTDREQEEAHQVTAERNKPLSWWQTALIWLGGVGVAYVAIRIYWRKMP